MSSSNSVLNDSEGWGEAVGMGAGISEGGGGGGRKAGGERRELGRELGSDEVAGEMALGRRNWGGFGKGEQGGEESWGGGGRGNAGVELELKGVLGTSLGLGDRMVGAWEIAGVLPLEPSEILRESGTWGNRGDAWGALGDGWT